MTPTTQPFLERVQEAGGFDSEAAAETIARATLSELGESLSTGEAADVAEFLPPSLEDEIRTESPEPSAPKDYSQFVRDLADSADLDEETAEVRARGVAAALAERMPDEYENARAQFTPAYDRLFDVDGLPFRSFSEAVSERLDLSADEARTVTRATLETLGDRLTGGEADDIARYVRGDAATWLRDTDEAAEDLSREQFVARAADRMGVDEAEARVRVHAVLGVLTDVVPQPEIERAEDQLPEGFVQLFAGG